MPVELDCWIEYHFSLWNIHHLKEAISQIPTITMYVMPENAHQELGRLWNEDKVLRLKHKWIVTIPLVA